jgi:mono/diheme cytochrome c family protein
MRGSRRALAKALTAAAFVAGLLGIAACSTNAPSAQSAALNSESETSGWKGSEAARRDRGDIAAGRSIAQRECAMCHEIDQGFASPHPGAPPFRDILFLNDSNWIAYRLIDAVRMGHDGMPLFDFDVRSADNLIAYIESIDTVSGEQP